MFSKRLECSWTEGYSWKTALALSVTLGGFGADRYRKQTGTVADPDPSEANPDFVCRIRIVYFVSGTGLEPFWVV